MTTEAPFDDAGPSERRTSAAPGCAAFLFFMAWTQLLSIFALWSDRVLEQGPARIGMPEVGIFDSADPNAFATGMRRNAALVAVSTGLWRNMNRDEVEAVLAHEVSHIANGDMVTLALIQGVVNTFVIFLSRIIGHFVDRVILKNERGHGIGYFDSSLVAQILLGILASMIVAWFPRRPEFRAAEDGAPTAGRVDTTATM